MHEYQLNKRTVPIKGRERRKEGRREGGEKGKRGGKGSLEGERE